MRNRAAVLTIADADLAAGEVERLVAVVVDELPGLDATLVHRESVDGDYDTLRRAAETWIGRCDLLLLLGGCGVGPRDVTPDAVAALIDKPLPGFGEQMRTRLCVQDPNAAARRWGGGVAGSTLVVWLPGAIDACKACLSSLTPAILDVCRQIRNR
ncbi:MAG: hypothetical protein JXO22_07535 [Phycisphaerae bacterium]|nr:hypothetical protein [Phycisphaerae bacterium]